MPDYAALDRYLGYRYGTARSAAAMLAKSLVPLEAFGREVATSPVDVLLLQPQPAAARRHARLASALAAMGLRVAEEILPGARELIARAKVARPAGGWAQVPRRWRLQAGYAAWIRARHAPRVVVTFMDDSVHTPFLHAAQASAGGTLANVAHAIFWPNLDFSMCDVDWLLLWGERSLANLRAAPVRFGACRALVVGSIYLASRAPAAPRAAAGTPARLLWLGQDLRSGHRAALERDALAFAAFAAGNPQLEIVARPHPTDAGELRRLLGPRLPRARWADAGQSLPEALEQADIALASFSSGLVDAAARAVPVVAFATSGLAQPIGLADHGLPVVATEGELDAAVRSILGDYPRASAAALGLARDHLHGLDDATGRVAQAIAAMARGADPADGRAAEALPGKDEWRAS